MVQVPRETALFASLDDEELRELSALGSERRLAAGQDLFLEGQPATHFHLVLEGELETTRTVAGEQAVMMRHGAGGTMGAIALLTAGTYHASTRALTDARLVEWDGDAFLEFVFTHRSVLREMLRVFAPVMGTIQGLARDREKLLALGKLSAGLAHELNNPAAAAVRTADALRELGTARDVALDELLSGGLDAGALHALIELDPPAAAPLSALQAADREEHLVGELDARAVDDADAIAAALVEGGVDDATVARVFELVPGPDLIAPALRLVAERAARAVVLDDLHRSTLRIAQLVDALKQYALLDRAPRLTVDIHEGLDSTVAILAPLLRDADVAVVREYAPAPLSIEAYGSELNQVWTHLLDNAIAATAGRDDAAVTLRTRTEPGRVVVEVADNGPGIPDEIQAQIFEAFFTTKPVGSGTGLGLDIARRIVVRHRGELLVESAPGQTCFRVLLPTS